jgi:predicted TIM-barrel enzyme
VRLENIRDFLPVADGFIVASSLKLNGKLSNPVDVKRVAALVRALRA